MNWKRITALLLAMLMLLPLVGCGSAAPENPPKDTEKETPTETAAPSAETSAVPEETAAPAALYSANLTPADYGGASFGIFTSNSLNSWTLPTTINHADSETGEVVNDALFARDRWLEETYSVKLNYTVDDVTHTTQVTPMLKNSILAGDTTYQLVLQDVATVSKPLTTDGCAYPLNLVPGIQLNAEYWFPELNEALRFSGDLYLAASAISPRFYGSVYLYLFNRELAVDLNLPNLYDIVESGKWTLDRQYELSEAALSDLDGDGAYGNGDRYGLIWEVLTPEAVVLGCGYHIVSSVEGQMTIQLGNEDLIAILMEMDENFHKDYAFQDGNTKLDTESIINGGQFLFLNTCTFNLAEYRELEFDYGILPMPKADEAQEYYIGYAQPWVVVSPIIPITTTGDTLAITGTLTDAMAAYGVDYLRPAVFDNVIQMKGTRDEQSTRIIGSMFDHVTFELATIYGFGSLYSTFTSMFNNHGSKKLVSTYNKINAASEAPLEKTVDNYRVITERIRNG